MDITLERILSLLPKTDQGTYVRGAKAEFARSLGYDSGDIVSMWIKGTSRSYYGKLHEIAAKYGVPIEWLQGKVNDTEDPAPADSQSGITGKEWELVRLFRELPEDLQEDTLAQLRGVLERRGLLPKQS